MTKNYEIHHTFEQVAAIQTFAIDHLINSAEKIRTSYIQQLRSRISDLEKTCSIARGEIVSHSNANLENVEDILKRHSEAHNAQTILCFMKESGRKKIELDTSRDMFEQILVMALNPENCPPDYAVAPRLKFEAGIYTIVGLELKDKRHTGPSAYPEVEAQLKRIADGEPLAKLKP